MSDTNVPKSYQLLRRFLLSHTANDYTTDDDLVVAFPRSAIESIIKRSIESKWTAVDQRNTTERVGFLSIDTKRDLEGLQQALWDYALCNSKKNVINPNPQLAKIVVIVVLKGIKSKKFLFIPRGDTEILPNMLALGPMKSIRLHSLIQPFNQAYRTSSFGMLSKHSPIVDTISSEIRINLHALSLPSIFPELEYVTMSDVKHAGFVGGGKDLGLVLMIEKSLPEIELIAQNVGGIVLEATEYTSQYVRSNFNVGIDGWSEAVINYVLH